MDKFLDDAWRTGKPPFHGLTLVPADSLGLGELSALLKLAVDWLDRTYTPRDLLTLDDWHNHDGFVKPATPTTWDKVQATVTDERKLLASRAGDYQVFRAVYPPTAEWLLRWYLDEDQDLEGGEFSVSRASDAASGLTEVLRSHTSLDVHPSAEWFASVYGG